MYEISLFCILLVRFKQKICVHHGKQKDQKTETHLLSDDEADELAVLLGINLYFFMGGKFETVMGDTLNRYHQNISLFISCPDYFFANSLLSVLLYEKLTVLLYENLPVQSYLLHLPGLRREVVNSL